MAPKLHLYGLSGACSMAPHILLLEAGLDHDKTLYKKEDLIKQGGYPSDFVALNPKAKVPVLTTDSEVITENIAIFTYIAQLAPGKNLLGKTPLDTVRAYEWLSYLSSAVHTHAFGMLFRPGRFTDAADGSLDKHVLAKGKSTLVESLKYVEEKLSGKTWAVGDDFTAVDAYLFVFYQWSVKVAQLPMEKDYPNYARIVGQVAQRPAVQQMLKAEGLA